MKPREREREGERELERGGRAFRQRLRIRRTRFLGSAWFVGPTPGDSTAGPCRTAKFPEPCQSGPGGGATKLPTGERRHGENPVSKKRSCVLRQRGEFDANKKIAPPPCRQGPPLLRHAELGRAGPPPKPATATSAAPRPRASPPTPRLFRLPPSPCPPSGRNCTTPICCARVAPLHARARARRPPPPPLRASRRARSAAPSQRSSSARRVTPPPSAKRPPRPSALSCRRHTHSRRRRGSRHPTSARHAAAARAVCCYRLRPATRKLASWGPREPPCWQGGVG